MRPAWLAVGVAEAAATEGFNPERLSRLASRLLAVFEESIERVTRRGRPKAPQALEGSGTAAETGRLRALLAVATSILACVPLRKTQVRPLVLGAWMRLRKQEPSLTQASFCAALALPERTLRDWLARDRGRPKEGDGAPPIAEPKRKPKRRRSLRRPRFRFDVFLPGLQIGSDTTDIAAFGVPLKLVAAQDIGGRDASLFKSVVIDTRESSEHVQRVMSEAIGRCEGVQGVTDQGSPYMAEATKRALEELGAEHAPQKEGDPCGKATVERGFGSLKTLCAPLLVLSDSLAERLPALRDPELASAYVQLVVGVVLRAFQAGARAAKRAIDVRGAMSEAELLGAADKARAAARATERSARLLLAHIHELYGMARSVVTFINLFRRYPLDVLRDAEARLRVQIGRHDGIRDINRYFAALVRAAHAEHVGMQAKLRAHRADAHHLVRERAARDAQTHAWIADPAAWLRNALNALAVQWLPERRQLLFDGEGAGLGWMRAALKALTATAGVATATDIAHGVAAAFRAASRDRLADDGLDAIAALLNRELETLRKTSSNTSVATDVGSAILHSIGRSRRPSHSSLLPN